MDTRVRHNDSSAQAISVPEGTHGKARNLPEVIAGALLSITGIGLILSIITNEALYPIARHYSTFTNTISDLSGTEPPNSYMVQPNRLIFIFTMAVSGALVLTATYLLWRIVDRRRFLVALGLLGVGMVGIAVFPGSVATIHPLFSLVAFIGGSIGSDPFPQGPRRTASLLRDLAGVDRAPCDGVWPRFVRELGTASRDRDRRGRTVDRLPGPAVARLDRWCPHGEGCPPESRSDLARKANGVGTRNTGSARKCVPPLRYPPSLEGARVAYDSCASIEVDARRGLASRPIRTLLLAFAVIQTAGAAESDCTAAFYCSVEQRRNTLLQDAEQLPAPSTAPVCVRLPSGALMSG